MNPTWKMVSDEGGQTVWQRHKMLVVVRRVDKDEVLVACPDAIAKRVRHDFGLESAQAVQFAGRTGFIVREVADDR